MDVQAAGERIEALFEGLRSEVDQRVFDHVEELLRVLTELYGAGLARVVELAGTEAPALLAHLADDALVGSLLVAHDLHPDDLRTRVEAALESVRPFLGAHGGGVDLLDLDPARGAVHLRLLGSCDGCPSSAVTLRMAVERAIAEAAPEIAILDVEEPAREATAAFVELGRKPMAPATAEIFDPATGCGVALAGEVVSG
jgi:Fe-S cluster biogenesis protein NfuA